MATATSPRKPMTWRQRLRMARNVALGLLILFALYLVWNWGSIKGQARLGVAYGAHVACSCRYIAGRDMASCESDKEAGMGMISFSDDPEHKRVTASVPFLAEAIAERRGAYGCINLSEAEIEAAD